MLQKNKLRSHSTSMKHDWTLFPGGKHKLTFASGDFIFGNFVEVIPGKRKIYQAHSVTIRKRVETDLVPERGWKGNQQTKPAAFTREVLAEKLHDYTYLVVKSCNPRSNTQS